MMGFDQQEAAAAGAHAARRGSEGVRGRLTVPLEVTIRECRREDLPGLEWYGLYTLHKEIIHQTFERQLRGQAVMLLAVANGFPAGQVWVDLERGRAERVGLLWAVRVYPFLQGAGIGSRLLAAAEAVLRERGFRYAEIGVEKDNPRARRLYERTGYRVHRELVEAFSYRDWSGEEVRVEVDEWMMRKELPRTGVAAGRELAMGEAA